MSIHKLVQMIIPLLVFIEDGKKTAVGWIRPVDLERAKDFRRAARPQQTDCVLVSGQISLHQDALSWKSCLELLYTVFEFGGAGDLAEGVDSF